MSSENRWTPVDHLLFWLLLALPLFLIFGFGLDMVQITGWARGLAIAFTSIGIVAVIIIGHLRGRKTRLEGKPSGGFTSFDGAESVASFDVHEGPIRWVNVLMKREVAPGGGYVDEYVTDYGVPDRRLESDFPRTLIRTIRVKRFPLSGKVVDLRWTGRDFGLGIISRLNSDMSIKQAIMSSRDVIINAHRDHMCWTISTRTRDVASGELWSCYQMIARHLLAQFSQEDHAT